MLDLGYDIADFCAIDPVFGTMQEFDQLLDLLHARSIRLILDFVPDHTSDTHPWFRESRASRSSPKRSWFEPVWWKCLAMGRAECAILLPWLSS